MKDKNHKNVAQNKTTSYQTRRINHIQLKLIFGNHRVQKSRTWELKNVEIAFNCTFRGVGELGPRLTQYVAWAEVYFRTKTWMGPISSRKKGTASTQFLARVTLC